MTQKERHLVEMLIEAVRVSGRYRKDLGNIEGLAKSIASVGLLNPITVTPSGQLVAGQRRVEACRSLGWKKISCIVAEDLDTAADRLVAERDENTERKSMTMEELVELGLALEELERPKGQQRQSQAGTDYGRGIASDRATGSYPPAETPENRETRDIVGKALGMGGTTYNRAKAVVQAARDSDLSPVEQDLARQALDDMNATGNVTGNYEKIREMRAGTGARRPTISEAKSQRRAIGAAAVSLSGLSIGLKRVEGIHPDITKEEAAQWVDDLSEARLTLERLIRRLKEHINA